MASEFPPDRRSVTDTILSPWVTLRAVGLKSSVDGTPDPSTVYHGLAQADYVTIPAMRRDGAIVLVRQHRLMIGVDTWEPPAGLVDPGEAPETAARRELAEETGLAILDFVDLPWTWADPGRLTNKVHAFFALVEGDLRAEAGLEAQWHAGEDLREALYGPPAAPSHHLLAFLLAGASDRVSAILRSCGLSSPPWLFRL